MRATVVVDRPFDEALSLLAPRLTEEGREALVRSWQEEHDVRVRLEERLKASEARAQMWREMALNGDGGGNVDAG